VTSLANGLSSCDTWDEAVAILGRAPTAALSQAIIDSLARRQPTMKGIWQGLALNDYELVACDPDERGPAVAAYRATMSVIDLQALGKYRWILKYPEVNSVFHLVQAQRHLLRACAEACDEQPRKFAVGLSRDYHPLAFWTLVLRYNARRDNEHFTRPHEIRYPPPSEPESLEYSVVAIPEADLLCRAWLGALFMDPEAVVPFFANSYRETRATDTAPKKKDARKRRRSPQSKLPECPMIPLRCPKRWFPR
jgi:hypothetical protein